MSEPDKSTATELSSERDRLFADEGRAPESFRFDESVARVFPDMLRRSIPGYSSLLHLIGVLAARVVKSESHVYDLGCSLGAVTLSIRHAIGARDARLVALDNSPAMVERCREVMSADSGLCPVHVTLGDITNLELKPSSLIVLNFTLQFADPVKRASILAQISDALLPGGVLVLSEKTSGGSPEEESFYAELHDAFRESNGYSRLELSRKRQALEDYLIPQTVDSHETQLRSAGLLPRQWFRCLHFVSWVAVKP